MKMISFIVTTYDLEDWLVRRCLSSIVTQGLARDEYEIIVVDDESNVSPQHIVDEFSTKANIALYRQKHSRQGAARNLGLRHARGSWIQFVDGDDYLFEGAVRPLLSSAQAYKLDLLMFGFRKVYGTGDWRCEKGHLERSLCHVPQSVISGNTYMSRHNLFGGCWLMLFRRQLLEAPQFGTPLRFTEGIYIEDEEFVTKLVWRSQRMAKVDVPVYAYYQRSDSTIHRCSTEHTDELFRNYFIVLNQLLDFEAFLTGRPHDGVTRKIRFLSVDILRRALREPDWRRRWEYSVHQLHLLGLYPLPDAGYSWRYSIFRLLCRCSIGRLALRLTENRMTT